MRLGRLVLLVVLLGLTSCSPEVTSEEGPAQDPRYGAPIPSAPRDVRPYSDDPCAGPLDAAMWESLGFAERGLRRSLPTSEVVCRREGRNRERFVSFIVVPGRDVLVDTYRVRQFALFAPTTVGGLPATREQASPESLSCSVTVGTAEGQGFIVNFDSASIGSRGEAQNPCRLGQQVADRIVAALPPLPAK
jgi:hypothetical protein